MTAKTKRKAAANDSLTTVSDSQSLAIDCLATGGMTIEAAEAARVTRQTVSKWRNHHAGFQAELNRRRAELNEERQDRIRDIDGQALDVIREAVADGNLTASLEWARMRKLSEVDVDRIGSTNADEILHAHAAEVRSRPENQDSVTKMLEESFGGGISIAEARVIAEGEIRAALDELNGGLR
jgi:hypothetical protein